MDLGENGVPRGDASLLLLLLLQACRMRAENSAQDHKQFQLLRHSLRTMYIYVEPTNGSRYALALRPVPVRRGQRGPPLFHSVLRDCLVAVGVC